MCRGRTFGCVAAIACGMVRACLAYHFDRSAWYCIPLFAACHTSKATARHGLGTGSGTAWSAAPERRQASNASPTRTCSRVQRTVLLSKLPTRTRQVQPSLAWQGVTLGWWGFACWGVCGISQTQKTRRKGRAGESERGRKRVTCSAAASVVTLGAWSAAQMPRCRLASALPHQTFRRCHHAQCLDGAPVPRQCHNAPAPRRCRCKWAFCAAPP